MRIGWSHAAQPAAGHANAAANSSITRTGNNTLAAGIHNPSANSAPSPARAVPPPGVLATRPTWPLICKPRPRLQEPHLQERTFMPAMPSILGTDVGGTFTDFVLITGAGELHCFKVPSTPSRPGASILGGVDEIQATLSLEGAAWRGMIHTHSSTVATNA